MLPHIAHKQQSIYSRLDNAAFLTRQYFEEELTQYGYAEHVPLAVLRQYPPFPPSALICKLYMRFGPRFLHRLRGHWSFICYDSVTMRVLAAREPYGERMWLGKLLDESIFVSLGGTLPPGTAEVQELLPGCYKYGWHCEPLQFAPAPQQQQQQQDEPPSPSKKKTRRGARGGRRRSRSGTSPPCSPRVRVPTTILLCIIVTAPRHRLTAAATASTALPTQPLTTTTTWCSSLSTRRAPLRSRACHWTSRAPSPRRA